MKDHIFLILPTLHMLKVSLEVQKYRWHHLMCSKYHAVSSSSLTSILASKAMKAYTWGDPEIHQIWTHSQASQVIVKNQKSPISDSTLRLTECDSLWVHTHVSIYKCCTLFFLIIICYFYFLSLWEFTTKAETWSHVWPLIISLIRSPTSVTSNHWRTGSHFRVLTEQSQK